MTTSGTKSENEWRNDWYNEVAQRMTMSDYCDQFCFFFSREDATNRHLKENPLNLEEECEEDLLN